ncbi:MAG: hypothetical protein Q9197_001331 [Variospora fuerteventurae]
MGVNIGLGSAELPDKGYQLYITALVMVLVAGLVVLGRFAARWAQKSYGWDDYAILVSLVFSIVLTVMINLAVVNGYGRHKLSLEPSELRNALKYFYIAQVVYKIVVGFNKISILMLYLRIFISKPFRLACYINLGIVAAFTIGSVFATILQCIPIKASWNRDMEATCTNSASFWIAFAVINILTDAIILFLPMREVLHLQLGRREKIGLLALFSLGALSVTAPVHPQLIDSASQQSQTPPTIKAISRNFIPRGIWTLIEANTGIICASLPMLYKPAAVFLPCFRRTNISASSRFKNPYLKHSKSSGAVRRGYSVHSGKAPPWATPDSASVLPLKKGRRYQKQEFGTRSDLWEKDEDEYPLGGGEPLPLHDMGSNVGRGQIKRQVDVDITFQDHMGRAMTSDHRVQDAREAVQVTS